MDTGINPIVVAARETLRARHRAYVADKKTKFEAKIEQEWDRAERARKEAFVSKYRYDHAPSFTYPYSGISDSEAVRIATPREDRVRVLGENGCLKELLYVFLARQPGHRATVDEAKSFFALFIPVDGDATITESVGVGGARHVVTHAQKLSPQLADLLAGAFAVDVRFGRITWTPGEEIEMDEY